MRPNRPFISTAAPKSGWASSRKRYEWDEGQSELKRDEALEEDLFGEENHVNTGINFKEYKQVDIKVKGESPPPIKLFSDIDLHPSIMNNIKLAKYVEPTPVQAYTIPIVLEGLDLMACAQTGSGKTAAFLIPILSNLCKNPPSNTSDEIKANIVSQWSKYDNGPRRTSACATPSVLIIAPTRELSIQIFEESCRFSYLSKMRPCSVYGGSSITEQKAELARGCNILTGTPGRLKDFITRRVVSLKNLKFLVIDEADRMLEMGFENDLRAILEGDCPKPSERQTLLFSATFPKSIRQLCKDFMRKYLFLAVGRVGGTSKNITQKLVYVEDRDKKKALMDILMKSKPCKTLIFLETKRAADTLDDYLFNEGLPCTSIHGDRTQAEREDALSAFKNDQTPILVATSVAARGLDIKDVKHVINYDLCSTIDEYVHRIGRTARAGNIGTATSFFNYKNEGIAYDLVKLLIETNHEIPEFLKKYAHKYALLSKLIYGANNYTLGSRLLSKKKNIIRTKKNGKVLQLNLVNVP
ncbi:DEAD-domain-containing protein [Neoconidiobolus thromboides FSU 785]|nr:DEAD-domain-containing protein [Neoconidiobolus thromboides FSU 785]